MNFGIIFKAIGAFVIIGGLLLTGFVIGGSWASGMTEDSILRRVEHCMPAQSAEDVRPCLATSEEP